MKINPINYLKNPEDLTTLADARTIKAARLILEAVEIKQKELLIELIEKPKESPSDILKDVRAIIGMNYMSEWTLTLTQSAKKHLSKIEGE